eukprot:scpid65109/ scgid8773/ 
MTFTLLSTLPPAAGTAAVGAAVAGAALVVAPELVPVATEVVAPGPGAAAELAAADADGCGSAGSSRLLRTPALAPSMVIPLNNPSKRSPTQRPFFLRGEYRSSDSHKAQTPNTNEWCGRTGVARNPCTDLLITWKQIGVDRTGSFRGTHSHMWANITFDRCEECDGVVHSSQDST